MTGEDVNLTAWKVLQGERDNALAEVERLRAQKADAERRANQQRANAEREYAQVVELSAHLDAIHDLCNAIRSDSVLGVSPGARLTLIRQVLAASGRGHAPAESHGERTAGVEPSDGSGKTPEALGGAALARNYDPCPTVNSGDPLAYAKYALRLDQTYPGWHNDPLKRMTPGLAHEARLRRGTANGGAGTIEAKGGGDE